MFYVGMTRAIETLTLLHTGTQHAWLPLLADAETVPQHFEFRPDWDTEYRTLELKELDIGFAGRDRQRPAQTANIKNRLQAIADLQTGSRLTVRANGAVYEFLVAGEVVARTAKQAALPPLPPDTEAYAAEFYVRYREQEDAAYQEAYPADLDRWTVVVPQIVIKPNPSTEKSEQLRK